MMQQFLSRTAFSGKVLRHFCPCFAARFGVEQRARLAAKAHPPPHVLYMTATPIPRSLALIAHGDLAMVSIAGLPPGRIPVATRALLDTPTNRALVGTPLFTQPHGCTHH